MRKLADEVRGKFWCSEETVPETPLPGRPATRDEREAALQQLLLMVADEQRALVDDVPLRCSFGPPSGSFSPLDLAGPVVMLIEGTRWCHVCARAQDVHGYFDTRQPWETYDYYCLEVNGNRCVCVTHDGQVMTYGGEPDDVTARSADA